MQLVVVFTEFCVLFACICQYLDPQRKFDHMDISTSRIYCASISIEMLYNSTVNGSTPLLKMCPSVTAVIIHRPIKNVDL